MATNDYLPFANSSSANVAPLTDYAANSGWAGGYLAGVAPSRYLNRTWRQSSTMAAAWGQICVDYGQVNAVDDGVVANLEASLVAGIKGIANGRLLAVRVFATPGTFTYIPTPGTLSQVFSVQGGGGAGGGASPTTATQLAAGAGGGGGGFAQSRFGTPVSGTIVVGAGGLPIPGSNGSAGSASSFGSITATGGTGGTGGPAQTTSSATTANGGSSGGVGTGGNLFNSGGGSGGYALYGSNPISGQGGGSMFGLGGGAVSSTSGGFPSPSPGAGGGGGALQGTNSSAQGGVGGNGIVIIWEYA